MPLLGILLGITMLFLIGKALVETIWGLALICFGILCLVVSWIFRGSAALVGMLARLNRAANW
jgi:hypothetical protein